MCNRTGVNMDNLLKTKNKARKRALPWLLITALAVSGAGRIVSVTRRNMNQ